MKKISFIILLVITLFFFNLNKVAAFVGDYAYDINSLQLVNNDIVIKGWAAMNYKTGTTSQAESSYKMNNVYSKYELNLVWKDTDGNELRRTVINNSISSDRRDYTGIWFGNTFSEPMCKYRSSDCPFSTRGTSKCQKSYPGNLCNKNKMYVNIDFKFSIPLQTLIENSRDPNSKYIYLDLAITSFDTSRSVYGYSVGTAAKNMTIHMGMQRNRLRGISVDQLNERLAGSGITMDFIDPVDKVKIIATHGIAYRNDSGSTTIYFVTGNEYTVQDDKANGAFGAFTYYLHVKRDGNHYIDGGSIDETVSAYWTKPSEEKPIRIVIGQVPCAERLECQESTGFKNGTVICPTTCCTELKPKWDKPEHADTAFYKACTPPVVTCPNPIDEREVVCPGIGNTTTTFNKDLSSSCPAVDNDLCRINCKETVNVTFEPTKSIKAGMGFAYPVGITATRTCGIEYTGVDSWKTNMDNAVTSAGNNYAKWKASHSAADKTAYERDMTIIDGLNADFDYCDFGWRSANVYDVNPEVYAEIDTSTKDNDRVNYEKTLNTLDKSITSGNNKSVTVKKCVPENGVNPSCNSETTETRTYASWDEISNLNISYEMPIRYAKKYSGDISSMGGDDYYPGVRNYFTDFTELSGSYDFDVHVNGLGSNILYGSSDAAKRWSVTDSCSYDVNNIIFPQHGDPNYDEYGSAGFMYRQVSLTNPFPGGRAAGANWFGKEDLITGEGLGYRVYEREPLYLVKLQPVDMLNIREYYSSNNLNYHDNDLDNEGLSWFIHSGTSPFSKLFIRK